MIFVVLDAELELFLAAADEIVVEVDAHQKTFDEISSSPRCFLLIVAVFEFFSKDLYFPVKNSLPDLKKNDKSRICKRPYQIKNFFRKSKNGMECDKLCEDIECAFLFWN